MRRPSARCSGSPSGFSLGFSLIEVIVVLAVISIMASMAVPLAAKVIDQSRTEATRKQMEEIYKAIVGDPALGTAGYVGDMGRLPQNLGQLNTRLPGQPNPFPNPSLGVRMGWWGPYVNSGFTLQSYQNDAWGKQYGYDPLTGRLTSNLPDGTSLTYPPSQVLFNGTLFVSLYLWNGTAYIPYQLADCPSMTVSFYYSNNGTQNSVLIPGPPDNVFSRSGLHAVKATCTAPAAMGQAVVFVPGNNQQAKLDLYLR